MKNNQWDGSEEIPPSLDQNGGRINIIPAEVRGKFRRHRNWTQVVLLAFFLITPWLSLNGQPLLLLDVINREFHFFGLHLFAHDTPLIFFIFAIFIFGLIFVTAVWGRVFCGWTCPQTVFIDAVFRRIEILIEGTYLTRRKDALAPMSVKKFIRKVIKWSLFVFASSVIAHSFIAFFVGSQKLMSMMAMDPRQNWNYFLLITSVTLIVLFDFAWFREQFCLIVCPYGRFQSVLISPQSLNPGYDVQRGEPRKGSVPAGEPTGDCVSCRRCVEVCPTGIDIRKGLQMECIACTACIDACDEIMVKVNKPKGLIRYMNVTGGSKVKLFSARALFSLAIVLICLALLLRTVLLRDELDISVLRGRDALYRELIVDGETFLSNHFRLHIKNQAAKDFKLKISGTMDGRALEIATPENPVNLRSGEDREIHLFIKFRGEWLSKGKGTARIVIENESGGKPSESSEIHLIGPVTLK